MASEDERTVYCGNLSEEVTDEILAELFLQAGPIESVRRPKNDSGAPKPFAFILYKYESAVPYALEIFRNTKLFSRLLKLNSRSTLRHTPVLQTDFYHNGYQEHDRGQMRDVRHDQQYDRGYRNDKSHHRDSHRSRSERRNSDEPKSWAEYNALRGHGLPANDQHRDDLRRPSEYPAESMSNAMLQQMPDFNALLQMGQQLMLPGVGFPSMVPGPDPGMFNMAPPPQARPDHHESRGHWRDYHEDRGSRREHPYNSDRRHHDRRYSSSHSSHDRERIDRRSR